MHEIISVFTKDMQVKSVNDEKERLLLNFTFLFSKKKILKCEVDVQKQNFTFISCNVSILNTIHIKI